MSKSIQERLKRLEYLYKCVCNSSGGGGGGSQTLAQTLDLGNTTGGENISISNGDAIILDNGSMLRKGTIDAGNGGSKGISQICGVGFEHKWEAGRLYIMNDGGTTIREVSHNFAVTPTGTDDVTKGFVQNSRWILDNGDVYVCSDPTEGAAVWELVNTGTTPTLQEVITNGRLFTENVDVRTNDLKVFNNDDFDNIFLIKSIDNSTGAYQLIQARNDACTVEWGDGDKASALSLFTNHAILGTYNSLGKAVNLVVPYKEDSGTAGITNFLLNKDKEAGFYTLATLDDITTPTLQQVTDEGNETTIPIIVKQTENETTTTLTSGSLNFEDIVNEGTTNLVFESSSIPNQQVLIKNETGTLALLSDIAALTLQEVTDEGNSTEQPIIVQGIEIKGDTDIINIGTSGTGATNTGSEVINIGTQAGENNTFNSVINIGKLATATADYQLTIGVASTLTHINLPTSNDLEVTLKDSVSPEIIAYESDITTPTLQEVTDAGNTTTNDVKVNSLGLYSNPQADYGYLSWDGDNGLVLKDDLTQILFRVDKGGSSLSFVNSDDFTAKLDATILTENRTFILPDADGTIAITADIPLLSERRNANNSSNNNINYCGTAANGSAESSTVWTIKRLTITASGSITTATATNVAWTNRESVIY